MISVPPADTISKAECPSQVILISFLAGGDAAASARTTTAKRSARAGRASPIFLARLAIPIVSRP